MPTIACFDDQKLSQELAQSAASGQGALLYVWSDRMVYSVQQLPVVQQAARDAGLRFVALTEQETCSAQLRQQEALRHFPTAFVITSAGLHRFPIVGAMPPAAWRLSIQQRMERP
jgi:hypothetical protein